MGVEIVKIRAFVFCKRLPVVRMKHNLSHILSTNIGGEEHYLCQCASLNGGYVGAHQGGLVLFTLHICEVSAHKDA